MVNQLKNIAVHIYSHINALLIKIGRKLEYIGPHRYTRIKNLGITTVLDIGASRGQSIQRRRRLLGKEIVFHCFEPLQKPYTILQQRYSNDQCIKLHNIALGSNNNESTMYVSNIDDSSSLLAPTEIMNNTYQGIHFNKKEIIKIRKLDEIRDSLKIVGPVLMKVDTQGFEGQVFAGAKETLERYISLIIVELSFQEFYKGQPLFNDICDQLANYGFIYYGSFEQSANPKDGTPLQQDSIFINKKFKNVC